MNNGDLADSLAVAHRTSKANARKLVDGVFAAIAEAVSRGDEVSLNGFGKFKVAQRVWQIQGQGRARKGRNPATGATIQIAASKKPTFAPAKSRKGQAQRMNFPGVALLAAPFLLRRGTAIFGT